MTAASSTVSVEMAVNNKSAMGLVIGQRALDAVVEASAKNCINVEKAFYDVVRQLRRQRQSPMKPVDRKGTNYGPQPGPRNNHDSDHQRIYRDHNKKRGTKCVIL